MEDRHHRNGQGTRLPDVLRHRDASRRRCRRSRSRPGDLPAGVTVRGSNRCPLGTLDVRPPETAAQSTQPPFSLRTAGGIKITKPLETYLHPDLPIDPPAPASVPSVYWVGPRHLAGDDGRLYDAVADTLAGLGWTSLTLVRGRREPDEAPEDRQVLRSTVLHISPDSLRWAQWVLPDEPFHLGNLPIAWQVSARSDLASPLAQWSAYFTPEVPGEVLGAFLAALDARDQPALPLGGPQLVLDAVTAHGWLRDVDQSAADAVDPTFSSHIHLGEVPPLIQDSDP